MPSTALRELRKGLGNAQALMSLERTYHDPPRPNEAQVVEGLRGGAAVLMVATFEGFARDVVEEHLALLVSRSLSVTLGRMRWHNAHATLKHAMEGVPGRRPKSRTDRVPDMINASRIVVADTINPAAFSQVLGNPSAERLAEVFKAMEFTDLYARIKQDFERRWGQPVATTFIRDKLDEVVSRRHEVAHTGRALTISRADLKESVRFLRSLGSVLDMRLKRHVRRLRRIA